MNGIPSPPSDWPAGIPWAAKECGHWLTGNKRVCLNWTEFKLLRNLISEWLTGLFLPHLSLIKKKQGENYLDLREGWLSGSALRRSLAVFLLSFKHPFIQDKKKGEGVWGGADDTLSHRILARQNSFVFLFLLKEGIAGSGANDAVGLCLRSTARVEGVIGSVSETSNLALKMRRNFHRKKNIGRIEGKWKRRIIKNYQNKSFSLQEKLYQSHGSRKIKVSSELS